jgi:FkbH-like protein
MTPSSSTPARYGAILAGAFRRRRDDLVRALFRAARDRTCASWEQPLDFDDVAEWGRSHLDTAVELLAQSFATANPLYQELFEGWVRSRMVADLSAERVPDDYDPGRAVQLAAGHWKEIVAPVCPKEAAAVLEDTLQRTAALLARKPTRHLRVLFIGDCIQFEIITALLGPCARDGIRITPSLMTERVQPQLRNQIRALAPDQLDLVFFSPFSHTYLPEYESVLKPRSLLLTGAGLSARLGPMLGEVVTTLQTLAAHLRGKVYVHNTGATVQDFGGPVGLAKYLGSWKNRARARQVVNDAIAQAVDRLQADTDERVQLLDENALRKEHGARALGKVYFQSHAFHPTLLGVELGRRLYHEAVYANAHLAGKKVVVCDLDNTLWDGLIGEGPVRHFAERQEVLLRLKARGVLLAINSKNDPKNIHWSGGRLGAGDFVAAQINWHAKAANMGRIHDELNLKTKDFVFIDDRADERARMQDAFADVLVLDATAPATWGALSHWARLLPRDPGEDRTRLYQERVRREQFLKEQSQRCSAEEDETPALHALGLSVVLREARRSDLKRAAELINRTNQFNLCGSRTTVRALQDGTGGRHSVLVAEASDRYGRMGMVGVMVAECKPGRVEIPLFVLSCRAFGFGIEYALLNALRKLAPRHSVVGHYKPTQFNEPCRKLYPSSGLTWDGQVWTGAVADLPADPAWLSVRNDLESKVDVSLPVAGA